MGYTQQSLTSLVESNGIIGDVAGEKFLRVALVRIILPLCIITTAALSRGLGHVIMNAFFIFENMPHLSQVLYCY